MYDARPKIETFSTGGRLLIACLAGCLAVALLGVVLFWPSADSRAALPDTKHQLNLIKAEAGIIELALKGFEVTDFERALISFDPGTHKRLETKLKDTPNRADALSVTILQMKQLLLDNAHLLERVDTEAIDSMLILTRARLRAASQDNSSYCQSRHFMALIASPNPEQALNQLLETLPLRVPGTSQYGLDIMAILLEAASQARRAPESHGAFTNVDRDTVQFLIDSLKTDPQIAPLLGLSPQSLTKADVCAIGASLIMAANTLPQATKGRLWADLMRGGHGLKKSR